jgi:DegV family protein with EDD domain
MASGVAVVTDSTAYLPVGVAEALGVRVVPLHVTLGDRTGSEDDVTPDEVAAALRDRRVRVTTSRPTPDDFARTYAAAFDAGADAVLSVHLSGALSGTWQSAALAAQHAAGPVRVVDSRSTAMGLGFAVMTAAELAAGGESLDKVYEAAERSLAGTRMLFYVDTLEHLRRGGRIRATAALVGTALAVKPILHLMDGAIVLKEKVRTATRALARLEELAVSEVADLLGAQRLGGAVDVAVQHLAAPERAAQLGDRLRGTVPELRRLFVSEVGAAIGAHVGPGVVGVVIVRV